MSARSLSRSTLFIICALVGALTFAPVFAQSADFQVPPGWPKVITIPSIEVQAKIENVGLQNPADYKAPRKWGDVAWFDMGAKPGDVGTASIFGHLDSTCCPAVFWNLKDLQKGDVLYVTYKNGQSIKFEVQWQRTYANIDLPLDLIYGPNDHRALVLLTCAGQFHTDGTGYDHKLLVYARAVLPDGSLG